MRMLKSLSAIFLILCLFAITSYREAPKEQKSLQLVRAMTLDAPAPFIMLAHPSHAEADGKGALNFEVGKAIIKLPVQGRNHTNKGKLLAQFDPRNFQNELEIALAEEQRAIAYKNHIAEALKVKAVSKQDLTDAIARVKVAKAFVNIRRKALEASVIKGPFDGTIAWPFEENYQRIQLREIVLRLRNIDPSHPAPISLKKIVTEASIYKHRYPVILAFSQEDDNRVLNGLTESTVSELKTIDIEGIDQIYEIPLSSIVASEDDQVQYVWIINKANMTVHKVKVTLETITTRGIRVKGLQAGQTIVTAGVYSLKSNQKVRIK